MTERAWASSIVGHPRLLVAATAFAAHAASLSGGFIWLDHAHIEEGAALVPHGASLVSLFTTGFAQTGFYRPLVSISLALDSILGGTTWLYHFDTLAWHVAASVMVLVAAAALGATMTAATLAGLIFGVHPATSLVAGVIAFRSEAMITVFLLSLVVFHLRAKPLAAAAALLCGAFAKETALVLAPLFIAALEMTSAAAKTTRAKRIPVLCAEGLALAFALSIRHLFAPHWRATFPSLSISEAIGTRFAALSKTAATMMAATPLDRTICDAFAVTSAASVQAIAGLLILLGIAYFAVVRRGPLLLLLLALLPSLHIVPIMRWWSPHYAYVPLAFAVMILGETLGTSDKRLLYTSLCVLWLAPQSVSDSLRFRSDDRLWISEIERHPECREAQFYVAEIYRERGRWDRAAEHYARAIAETAGVLSYVDLEATFANFGTVNLQRDRPEEARVLFEAALQRTQEETNRRRLRHNAATAALLAGQPDIAARELEAETSRSDALSESLLVRARALHELGRDSEARALLARLASAGSGLRTE